MLQPNSLLTDIRIGKHSQSLYRQNKSLGDCRISVTRREVVQAIFPQSGRPVTKIETCL